MSLHTAGVDPVLGPGPDANRQGVQVAIRVDRSREQIHQAAQAPVVTPPSGSFPFDKLPLELRMMVRERLLEPDARTLVKPDARTLVRLRSVNWEFRHDPQIVTALAEQFVDETWAFAFADEYIDLLRDVDVCLPQAQRKEFLETVGEKLVALDNDDAHYVLEPVLARHLILRINEAQPEPYRADLSGIEDGSAYETLYQAAAAGVPHDQLETLATLAEESLSQDIEQIADEAACALAIITDSTAERVAGEQKIQDPRRIDNIKSLLISSICALRWQSNREDVDVIAATYGVGRHDVERAPFSKKPKGRRSRWFPVKQTRAVFSRTAGTALPELGLRVVADDFGIYRDLPKYLLARRFENIRSVGHRASAARTLGGGRMMRLPARRQPSGKVREP